MVRYVFGPQELPALLRQHSRQFTTGYLRVYLRTPDQPEADETWLLAFYRRRLVFSAAEPLSTQSFLKRAARFIPRLNLGWSKRAIQVVQERLMRENSLQELIDGMTQLALLKDGEVEDALWMSLMTDFDRYLYDRAGTCRFEVHDILAKETPITGFELEPLLQQAAERRDQWLQIQTAIPTMLAVPVVNWERINQYKITNEQRHRLQTLTKDVKSLDAIAAKLARDRLEIAHLFALWVKKGIVSLQTPTELVASPRTKQTILAVDDSVVTQELLRQFLPDYRVITTGNPSELLNLLFQYHPDLVVLDVTMPGLDGLELSRIVRNLDEFRSIPILMLTARDGLIDRFRGKLSGATSYMTKPVDEVKLNREIERLLAQRSGAQPSPKSKTTDPPQRLVNDWQDPMLNTSTGV